MPEGMKLAGGARLLVCEVCGEAFMVHHTIGTAPKRCPRCNDQRQGRPSVIVSRLCEWEMDGILVRSLPRPDRESWQEFKAGPKDHPVYRISVKGKQFGADWVGRIELFAPRPIQLGEVVKVRAMIARHQTKVVNEVRQTLEHGPKPVQREVGLQSTEEGAVETLLERRYLVLEPSSAQPTGVDLVWDIAHTKTTLKGLGRQYWASVSGAPIKEWRIMGAARSGRFESIGVLAVVDREHPLIVRGTGDIQFERVHPAWTDVLTL